MKARLKRKIKHQKKYIQLEELKNLSENSEKNKDSIKIKKRKIKLYINDESFLRKHKKLILNILYLFLLLIVIFLVVYYFKSFNIRPIIKENIFEPKIKKLSDFNHIKNRTREPRDVALTKGKEYMKKCLEELLFTHNSSNFKLVENPKISVIIPIYNGEKIINKTIKSVQNQNMLDIEIIFVNDFSTDNTLLTLQKLKEEDPRIKIINNEKNMGILYSRSIGTLEAKGKYILNLDHDDFFFDERLFDELYEEAEEGNFDIVSFMDLEIRDYNADINNMRDGPCTHHPDNFIVVQPELPYYPLFKDDHFEYIDIQIWGKLFKTETYKRAVNLLGKERYSTYNIMNEDCVGTFSICIVSESYKYMRRYGLFHHVGGYSTVRKSSNDHKGEMIIFFSDIIFELSKKEYKYYSLLLLITGPSYLNENNKKLLKNFVDKVMKCEFIDDKYKAKIKDKYPDVMKSFNFTK